MNTSVSASRPSRLTSSLRAAVLTVTLLLPAAVQAQLVTLSQTYSVPQIIDGGARSVFYNFSSFGLGSDFSILSARLAIDFAKVPDLSDDPPFFSEIGLTLRKLDTSFSVLGETTLIGIGGFNDGAPGSFFDGSLTFDDTAATFVNDDPDSLSSGVFRPMGALSLLNGLFSPFWELRIDDASLQNPFWFRSATLTIAAAAAVAVPEPSTLAFVLLFALVVFAKSLRRRTAR